MITEHFGIPVVTADTIFTTLENMGVKRLQHREPPVPLTDYLQSELSEEERNEALRFAPQNEVVRLLDHQGDPYNGFRTRGKDWATVFALLPGDLIPLVGEYKHGVDEITIVLPSGVPNKDELTGPEPFVVAGRREFTEETGFQVENIAPLTEEPLMISGRQLTTRFQPLLAAVDLLTERGPSKLDKTEKLALVLTTSLEWMKMIKRGAGVEECAVSTTFLALQLLGKIADLFKA